MADKRAGLIAELIRPLRVKPGSKVGKDGTIRHVMSGVNPQRWDAYQEVFSEMLSATSTPLAPWYVIPADHKWFARLCAAGQAQARAGAR
jgi:polyphosphate kinase 2 (PPK2 family)